MRRTLPKAAVGKDDRDDVDAVAGRGRQFLHIVHKPAIARDRHDRPVGAADFGAERGRKTEPQRVLIAAVDVGARLIDRERHPADIADLRQVLDIDAVIGQFGADRPQIFALWAELFLNPGEGSRL
jgi:hypothetical protein